MSDNNGLIVFEEKKLKQLKAALEKASLMDSLKMKYIVTELAREIYEFFIIDLNNDTAQEWRNRVGLNMVVIAAHHATQFVEALELEEKSSPGTILSINVYDDVDSLPKGIQDSLHKKNS